MKLDRDKLSLAERNREDNIPDGITDVEAEFFSALTKERILKLYSDLYRPDFLVYGYNDTFRDFFSLGRK